MNLIEKINQAALSFNFEQKPLISKHLNESPNTSSTSDLNPIKYPIKKVLSDIKKYSPSSFKEKMLMYQTLSPKLNQALYSFKGQLSTFNEEVMEINIGKARTLLHIPRAGGHPIVKKDIPLFGGSSIDDLFTVFGDYVKKAANSAFELYKKVNIHNQNLFEIEFKEISDYATTYDLVFNRKIENIEDIIPRDIFLLPEGNKNYLGLAGRAQSFPVFINVKSIFYDKIFSGEATVGSHEFIHNRIQNISSMIHPELGTRFSDLASGDDTWFFLEMFHGYTQNTDLSDIINLYLDSGIGSQLFSSIKEGESSVTLWNEDAILNEYLFERVKSIRTPLLDILFNLEASYQSPERFGLDTLVTLTGMNSFPAWITAYERFEPQISDDFALEYGYILSSIADKIKNIYIQQSSELLSKEHNFNSLPPLRDFHEHIVGLVLPELSPNEIEKSWHYMLASFYNSLGEIRELYTEDVYNMVRKQGNILLNIVGGLLNSPYTELGVSEFLKELSICDYLDCKIKRNMDYTDIFYKIFEKSDYFDLAEQLVRWNPEIILNDNGLESHFVALKTEEENLPKLMSEENVTLESKMENPKRTIKYLKQYDPTTGKDIKLKINILEDNEDTLIYCYKHKGPGYEKEPVGLIFNLFGNFPNYILYKKDLLESNFEGFTTVEKLSKGFSEIPFNLIYEKHETFISKALAILNPIKGYEAPELGQIEKVYYHSYGSFNEVILYHESGVSRHLSIEKEGKEYWTKHPFFIDTGYEKLFDPLMKGRFFFKMVREDFVGYLQKIEDLTQNIELMDPVESQLYLDLEEADFFENRLDKKGFYGKTYVTEDGEVFKNTIPPKNSFRLHLSYHIEGWADEFDLIYALNLIEVEGKLKEEVSSHPIGIMINSTNENFPQFYQREQDGSYRLSPNLIDYSKKKIINPFKIKDLKLENMLDFYPKLYPENPLFEAGVYCSYVLKGKNGSKIHSMYKANLGIPAKDISSIQYSGSFVELPNLDVYITKEPGFRKFAIGTYINQLNLEKEPMLYAEEIREGIIRVIQNTKVGIQLVYSIADEDIEKIF